MMRSIGVLLLLTVTVAALAAAEKCDRLEQAPLQELASYLRSAASSDPSNADCVSFAIYKLGENRYEPSIPELVRLLDFRRTPDEQEKLGYRIRMRGFYPAVDALEEIGSSTSSSLVQAIGADSTSALARKNAVKVLMDVYRDKPENAISLLRQERDNTTKPSAKNHLSSAISEALQSCNLANKTKCELAASRSQ